MWYLSHQYEDLLEAVVLRKESNITQCPFKNNIITFLGVVRWRRRVRRRSKRRREGEKVGGRKKDKSKHTISTQDK